MDSVPLQNNPLANFEGKTAGPDLVDVTTNESLNQATYIFDDKVANDSCDGSPGNLDVTKLGFYDSSGTKTNAGNCVNHNVNRVTADFDTTGEDVGDAERFFAEYDAVQDTDQSGDIEANPEGVVGGTTSRPDLIDVQQGPAKAQFDFEFDETLNSTSLTDSGFHVYADCGPPNDSPSKPCAPEVDTTNLLSDGRTVRVTFGVPTGFSDFPNEAITLGTVDVDAAESADSTGESNSVGAIAIAQTNQGEGFTDGPDLVDVEYRDGPDEVLFVFDETLRQSPGDVHPEESAVIDSTGTTTSANTDAAVSITDNELLIEFPSGKVSGAVGASVDNQPTDTTYEDSDQDLVEDEFGGSGTGSGNINSATAIGR
jgi:hypothetical protein